MSKMNWFFKSGRKGKKVQPRKEKIVCLIYNSLQIHKKTRHPLKGWRRVKFTLFGKSGVRSDDELCYD